MEDRLLQLPTDPHLPYHNVTIVHGAARGADSMAAVLGIRLGFKVIPCPANWERFGRAAGAIRNKWMADSEPDLVLAFHRDIGRSKGTKNMVELARKRNIPVEVIDD